MIRFTHEAANTLKQARSTYGSKNQIIVSIEECNELSAILAKYARYHDDESAIKELKSKVVDEAADVYIVLEHVKAIFDISDYELVSRMDKKIERLARWLNTSNDMEQTTIDRKVDDKE